MRFIVIPSEARNPSSIKTSRKERFLTSQTPFGMTNSRFWSLLLEIPANNSPLQKVALRYCQESLAFAGYLPLLG